MYLIVGLGNPGARYHNTRHNAGFLVIDKLAEFFKIETFEMENNYLYAVTDYKQYTGSNETGISQSELKQVVLMKPLTYMNLSGEAVKYFYDKYEIDRENILIIYDDVNIDLGVLRMRPGGSDGGQNGIKSIIYHMETDEIPRLRFGIKGGEEYEKLKLRDDFSLADYVLSPFEDNELELLERTAERSKEAVLSFINSGIKETMNLYNGRIPEEEN
ncbi:MAG TPA: aminoacyl-tRNA hydrolase [Ignavibacteria bacterium]|nr:aminoacyl-tRNA hydrolase [Ignavibacteria bacterium]